ncbi:MAG: FtsL-like putative cell division protein [Sediminibacterium sp.]
MSVPENKSNPKNPLKGLFSYEWILKNISFFLFLSLLAVLYIANGHMSDRTIRQINSINNELKELQYVYKTLKSEVMYKSEEAQIVKEAGPLGLKVSKDMPERINK